MEGEFEKLIIALKKAGVNKWKAKYVAENIKDGTQWSIVIKSSKLNCSIYGSNMYPDNFEKFKKYISKELLGGSVFQ